MSTVREVEVFPASVPVTRTFNFASGSAGRTGDAARLVYVKVTDSEGRVGWGEGRPHPQWSYESPSSVAGVIEEHLGQAITGMDIWDLRGLHRRMHAAVGRGPSTGFPVAKAAVDLAMHDLCAKAAGLPLRCFLGGTIEADTVELSWTIAVGGADEVDAEIARGREAGFRQFNFKVGSHPLPEEELLAQKVVEATEPGLMVWADANQGLPPAQAAELCSRLHERGVDVIEQPLAADQLHAMRTLRRRTPLRLAVDEASVSPSDFFQYVREDLVDFLVIKLTRSGGIRPTMDQVAVANAAGLPLLVSGLADGMLVKTAACQVAAACGYRGPAVLNGSQFMDDSALFPAKADVERGNTIHLGGALGIGIEPDEAELRRQRGV